MDTLTITSKRQVTLHDDILRHLGARPGDTIIVEKLADGRLEIRASARRTRKISDVFGCLKQADIRSLSIDEINEIAAEGWASRD